MFSRLLLMVAVRLCVVNGVAVIPAGSGRTGSLFPLLKLNEATTCPWIVTPEIKAMTSGVTL